MVSEANLWGNLLMSEPPSVAQTPHEGMGHVGGRGGPWREEETRGEGSGGKTNVWEDGD